VLEFGKFQALLLHTLGRLANLSTVQVQALYAHYCLVERWGRVLNLTRIRDVEEVIRLHYCESLFLGAHLGSGSRRVLDVGSGAGFPGVPVAILRPEFQLVLAESRHRKAAFLREATRELPNVRVHFGPAEELDEHFDWVLARAVRPKAILAIVRRLGDHVGLLLGHTEAATLTGGQEEPARNWASAQPHSDFWRRRNLGDTIPTRPSSEVRGLRRLGAISTIRWDPAVRLPWGERRFMLLGHVFRPAAPA